jgi:hypothetical protein
VTVYQVYIKDVNNYIIANLYYQNPHVYNFILHYIDIVDVEFYCYINLGQAL